MTDPSPQYAPLPAADEIARVWPMGTHPKLPRTRETVAIHEAGHAVVARTLHLPCHAIRIAGQAQEAVGGFVMSPAADLNIIGTPAIHSPAPIGYTTSLVHALAQAKHQSREQAALDLATMSAAGRQAEILAAGVPWPGTLWSEDRDGHDTRAYLAVAYPAPLGIGYVQRRARALLLQQWASLQQIVTHLVERGSWTPGKGETA